MISGDAQQIEQVFTNLIINASDALEGQPDARIVFKVESNKGSVSISCQDNGPGIPPEKLKSMWDPFFTTKPAGKGTGLGLSICRSIIECHDGSITVENVPEGGLKFNITLPLYTGE